MSTLVSGTACVDPVTLHRSCTQRPDPLPVDRWWGKANSFTLGPGRAPGRGWVLLTKAALDSLPLTADLTLTFSGADSDHVVTLQKITLLNRECVDPGAADDPGATYLCEVVDRRHLLGMVPVDVAYNLKLPDGTDYYTQTKNSGSAWTWQQVVTHLASAVLGIGALTLPFTPDATPENLVYWGHPSALEALCDVLARIGCDLAYDPVADTFAVVRLGSAGDTFLDAVTAGRLWDGYSSEAARGWRPEKVRVRFPRRPVDRTDGYTPYYAVDVTLAAAPGVQTGTVVQIDDDLSALGASGAPTNAAALATRAAERASDWLRKRAYYDRPVLRVWEDFLPGATGLGAYAARRVTFDDTGGPFATSAEARPDGALEAWRPLGGWPVWWPLTTAESLTFGCGFVYSDGAYSLDYDGLAGSGLFVEETEGCPKLGIAAGCGLIIGDGGAIEFDAGAVAGPGLISSGSCSLSVSVGCGLTLDGGAVALDLSEVVGNGLTWDGCSLYPDVGCGLFLGVGIEVDFDVLAGITAASGLLKRSDGPCDSLGIDTNVASTTTETLVTNTFISMVGGKLRQTETKVTYTNHFNAAGIHINRTAGSPADTYTEVDPCLFADCCAATTLSVVADADPTTATVDEDVDFTATPTGGVGPFTYVWEFGDSETGTGATPTHAYAEEGTYTATVTVTDACGETASGTVDVTVGGAEPGSSCAEAANGTVETTYSNTVPAMSSHWYHITGLTPGTNYYVECSGFSMFVNRIDVFDGTSCGDLVGVIGGMVGCTDMGTTGRTEIWVQVQSFTGSAYPYSFKITATPCP